jgi:hypothetical protein
VGLHLGTALPDIILQTPSGRVKSVADRDIDVFVGMAFGRVPVDHNLVTGESHIDPDMENLPLTVMMMGRFDENMATGDPVVESVQLGRLLPDVGLDGGRGIHPSKNDLEGGFHGISLKPKVSQFTAR